MHTVQGIDANGHTENMTVDLSEAGLGQENQLIITGEDGHGYPVSVSGMITVPVSSMYQMVANIQHLHQNGDGTVCLTPIQVSNGLSNGTMNKYHMLRAVAPANTIKYEVGGQHGGRIVEVGEGAPQITANGAVAQSGMSSGLASLMDVVQLEMKVENIDDFNNNDQNRGATSGLEKQPKSSGMATRRQNSTKSKG